MCIDLKYKDCNVQIRHSTTVIGKWIEISEFRYNCFEIYIWFQATKLGLF